MTLQFWVGVAATLYAVIGISLGSVLVYAYRWGEEEYHWVPQGLKNSSFRVWIIIIAATLLWPWFFGEIFWYWIRNYYLPSRKAPNSPAGS